MELVGKSEKECVRIQKRRLHHLKCCQPTVIHNRIRMLSGCYNPVFSAVYHEEEKKAYFLCFQCDKSAILGSLFTPMDPEEALVREVMES